MDDLLPKLLLFPPHPPPKNPLSDSSYEDGIKSQCSAVAKISEKNLLLQTSGGESPLDVINPSLNTVPYAFILIAHINTYKKGTKAIKLDALWGKISGFLESFDARQARYLGNEMFTIIEAAFSISRTSGQAFLAVAPVRDAILRLDPSGSVLTTAHLFLIKLALDSRMYDAVVPVLEKFVLYFPSAKDLPKPKYICDLGLSPASYITINSGLTTKMKPIDVMEYFLYSGMVYIGLQRWADALECLENTVTYPAKDGGVSKLMVEAYKKWVIVSVLLDGKARSLPKTTTSAASKAYHAIAKPYETVANIFETGTAARLKAEVECGQGVWHADCNTGLMRCILSAYQKSHIRNLGNVYTKISIPEILNLTMSAETGAKLSNITVMETLIRSMLQEGSLNATMSNAPGQPAILTFSPSGPVLTEAQMQRELAASAGRIHSLTLDIKQTDRMLTHEKDYITFAKKMKAKGNKFEMHDQGIGGEMEWNAMEDEELMTGVF